MEFNSFAKIGRLFKDCIITEKLDGTNAQVCFDDDMKMFVGSRNKWISPREDNYGFARWAYEHAEELRKLGPGRHFGEWWGQGIQRRYGLKEKRFSLFNTGRWWDNPDLPNCCYVVPILYVGPFSTDAVQQTMLSLSQNGSAASPGFMNPEGVIVYHAAKGVLFKCTYNDAHKTL